MPIIESTQHKLDRVRPPRVQITYDVEIGNAIEQVELPFVLGIIAHLSGKQPGGEQKEFSDREFVEVSRDTFSKAMRAIAPGLSVTVPKTIPDLQTGAAPAADAKLTDVLHFNSLDDFSPASIIQQVPELKLVYDLRQQLRDLLAELQVKPQLLVAQAS